MNRCLAFLLLVGAFFVTALPVYSEELAEAKHALLIANGDYPSFGALSGPVPEAEILKNALVSLGFEVKVVANANREDMLLALADFEKTLNQTGGIAFFHYGGHAVQVNGKNYLIPVGTDIPDEARVPTRALDVDEVYLAMGSSKSSANIIVLDACRNNPLPAASRSAVRGLSVVNRSIKNSIIVYSASAGTAAQDGVFTPILAAELLAPKVSLVDALRNTRTKTIDRTGGSQTPGSYDELTTPIYLNGKPEAGTVTVVQKVVEKVETVKKNVATDALGINVAEPLIVGVVSGLFGTLFLPVTVEYEHLFSNQIGLRGFVFYGHESLASGSVMESDSFNLNEIGAGAGFAWHEDGFNGFFAQCDLGLAWADGVFNSYNYSRLDLLVQPEVGVYLGNGGPVMFKVGGGLRSLVPLHESFAVTWNTVGNLVHYYLPVLDFSLQFAL